MRNTSKSQSGGRRAYQPQADRAGTTSGDAWAYAKAPKITDQHETGNDAEAEMILALARLRTQKR